MWSGWGAMENEMIGRIRIRASECSRVIVRCGCASVGVRAWCLLCGRDV